jgi:hypothetical protein
MPAITNFSLSDDILDVRDLIARVEELENLEPADEEEKWNNCDEYFTAYAQKLADDTGAVPANVHWPMTCIDWDMAARDLKMDYFFVEINGSTYWYR